MIDEVEDGEETADRRELAEDGFEVGLREDPEGIAPSEGGEGHGKAEVSDSEVVLREASEDPNQNRGYE